MSGTADCTVEAAPDVAVPRDPWARFGWVMGVIWLVFLAFPLYDAVTTDRPWWWRGLSVAVILGFGALYVHGIVRPPAAAGSGLRGWGWQYVAGLAGLAIVTAALIGADALGMAPYVVALGMFVLPLAGSLAVLGAAVGATAGTAIAVDEPGLLFLTGIVVLVGVSTGAVRYLDELGDSHRRLTRDLTVTAERERVARDVHDVLGHSLTVVTVKAELAERLVDSDPDRARAELAEIQALSRQALTEIRATVGGLRAPMVADQVDAARVALLGAGIRAELPGDASVVDPRHRIVLGWALREAVTNVVRHSAATRCHVDLGPSWLTVADDGRGLDGRPEGNGLTGLRERVAAAGGSVELASGAGDGTGVGVGAGTTVRVSL